MRRRWERRRKDGSRGRQPSKFQFLKSVIYVCPLFLIQSVLRLNNFFFFNFIFLAFQHPQGECPSKPWPLVHTESWGHCGLLERERGPDMSLAPSLSQLRDGSPYNSVPLTWLPSGSPWPGKPESNHIKSNRLWGKACLVCVN